MLFRPGGVGVSLFRKPFQKACHVQLSLYGGVMQDFHEVEKIGISSLTVREGDQAGHDFLITKKGAKQAEKPSLLPEVMVAPELHEPFLPPAFIQHQPLEF